MVAKIHAAMGAAVAITLVVAGMWGWGSATRLTAHAGRPELAGWAVRAASVAAFAAAQVLGMTFIVDRLYERDRAGEWLRLTAGAICTAGLIGALSMGVMSR